MRPILQELKQPIEDREGLIESINLPGEDWSRTPLGDSLGLPGVSNELPIEVVGAVRRPIQTQIDPIRQSVEDEIVAEGRVRPPNP